MEEELKGLLEAKKKLEEKEVGVREQLLKSKGPKEASLFTLLANLQVRTEPFHGELTLNGPNCLKFLRQSSELGTILAEVKLKDEYLELFSTLNVLAGYLLSTSPLRMYDLLPEEWILLHGPLDEGEDSPYTSDLCYLKLLCEDLGNYFGACFGDTIPTPKHHFAVFHVPQFASRWGSVGMFSEQAVERSHATTNTINRKLRPMANAEHKTTRRFMDLIGKSSTRAKGKEMTDVHFRKSL